MLGVSKSASRKEIKEKFYEVSSCNRGTRQHKSLVELSSLHSETALAHLSS